MDKTKKWGVRVLLMGSVFSLAGCSISLPQLTQEADQPKITVTKEEQEKYLNFLGDTTGQVLTLTASFLKIASDFVQDPKNIEAFSNAVSNTMSSFSQGVSQAIEKQKNMDVPPELKEVHNDLNQNLNQYEKGIADVNEGMQSGSVLQITSGILQIQQAKKEMEELQSQYVN